MSLVSIGDDIAGLQEAEFRVESSISVREQYKTKLHTFVDALLPPTKSSSSIPVGQPAQPNESSSPKATTTDASRKKQTRDAIADRLRVRATMPAGKELQVVGDWLLLLRAASVNVVESISHWRTVVHQRRPLPYEVNHANYLLQMLHDVDFLDRCDDLVDWLGFRLDRNPFIVAEGLGANARANLSVAFPGREGRQGKLNKHVHCSPPSILVKPLLSITPEDDIVDGSRIAVALGVLKDEEALYGRAKTWQFLQAHFAKPLGSLLHVSDDEDDDNGRTTKSSVFDDIAVMTKLVRRGEHRLHFLERENTRVTNLLKLVEDQIQCTTSHREQDLTSDHRVWSFREKCRETTLQAFRKALDGLNHRTELLKEAMTKAQATIAKRKQWLGQLVAQKDRKRQQRHEEKRRVEAEEIARRTGAIRRKTLERNRDFKAKRAKSKPDVDGDAVMLPASALFDEREPTDNVIVGEIAMTLGAPASPTYRRIELDHLRTQNLERRRQQRLHHEQVLSDALKEMNRRRDENALMFLEDKLSEILELRRRRLVHERLRRERAHKLTAAPICSIVQAIGGAGKGERKFVISVHQHIAKGYAPQGLRFVAYDPSTSNSYSLVMSTREYNSLGYGRTLDGLSSFCQWLCVVYVKRKRQFQLIWSGAPCPPPLRLREYDSALVCVHKEGIRLTRHPLGVSFIVAAVYIRTNDPSKLWFVTSHVNAAVDTVEYAVEGPHLLPKQSIRLRSDIEGGQLYASWLHTLGDGDDPSFDVERGNGTTATHRVYSGEMAGVDAHQPTRIHIYDVSSTEYELHIDRSPWEDVQSAVDSRRTIILLKHDVNPYRVRLPGSAFGDLVNCIKLERRHGGGEGTTPVVRAVILPSWRALLARYVRALRMAKFGAKVDGLFFVVVATLVQQKTEFRAHLLFELVPIGGIGSRHVLRIGLSQFLRCSDANWRITVAEAIGLAERTQGCNQCLENHRLAMAVPVTDAFGTITASDVDNEWRGLCTSCDATQRGRLAILRKMLDMGALSSDSDLATLYNATCSACGVVPPPIVVVMPTREENPNSTDDDHHHDAILRHCFTCFDNVVASSDAGTTAIRNTLAHSRICVIHMAAPTIGTYTNAASAAERAREILQLEQHNASSVTIAVVYRQLDIFNLDAGNTEIMSSSPEMLEQALRDTAAAILHVGDTAPIAISVGVDGGQQDIADFEGYLVSEALLVEATRVILHPDLEWRVPGATVGASSWSSACEFLQNPHQLSRDLQVRQSDFLSIDPVARQTLEAYAAHPRWPSSLEDVRAPFQALLSCVLHIVYVQHLLALSGGLITSTGGHLANDRVTQDTDSDDGIYDIQNGSKVIVSRHQSVPPR